MEHPFRIAIVGLSAALALAGRAAAVDEPGATASGAGWAGELGVVWAIVAAQVIAAAVAIGFAVARLARGGPSRVVPAGLLESVAANGGAGDWDGVLAAAKESPGALAELVVFIAEHRFNEVTHLQQAAAAAAGRAGERQLQHAAPIAVAGWSGAMLGLLGTVVGMWRAFAAAADQPGAVPASPFAAALTPVALGIALGVPVMLLHAWVEARSRRQALALSAAVDALIDAWFLKPENDARRKVKEDEAREREALRQAMRSRGASAKGGVAAAKGRE